jgi:hypothetical protein
MMLYGTKMMRAISVVYRPCVLDVYRVEACCSHRHCRHGQTRLTINAIAAIVTIVIIAINIITNIYCRHTGVRLSPSSSTGTDPAFHDVAGTFDAAKELLVCMHSSSSGGVNSSISNALLNLHHLFSAYTATRLAAVKGMLPASGSCAPASDDAAAAAAAAASSALRNQDDPRELPSLALATEHALLTALQPPAAAAIAVRAALHSAVKALTTLKKERLRQASPAPHPPRHSQTEHARGSSVAEAARLQVQRRVNVAVRVVGGVLRACASADVAAEGHCGPDAAAARLRSRGVEHERHGQNGATAESFDKHGLKQL